MPSPPERLIGARSGACNRIRGPRPWCDCDEDFDLHAGDRATLHESMIRTHDAAGLSTGRFGRGCLLKPGRPSESSEVGGESSPMTRQHHSREDQRRGRRGEEHADHGHDHHCGGTPLAFDHGGPPVSSTGVVALAVTCQVGTSPPQPPVSARISTAAWPPHCSTETLAP